MSEALIDCLSGHLEERSAKIYCVYHFHGAYPGTQRRASGSRAGAARYPDVAGDPDLCGWKPDTDPVHPSSHHKDL